MSTTTTKKAGGAAAVAAGIALAASIAAPQEGYMAYAYRDPVGVLTYCYGETQGAKDAVGRKFSEAECRALLERRMGHYEQGNAKCVPTYESLDVYVQAAFNDFSYNLGNGTFCTSSIGTLLRAGRVRDACYRITQFDKARVHGVLKPLPGLTKRRALEQMYCLKGSH
ncbi:glycoside hydrolase [Mesorhizobium sp.]|uniref:glycoside hydrolase family protein n=1 Tax=Mesorhizobium sp. TaxID=1871066 RepID=UPI000FE93B69|nr:glycoside hydrolase [Mesorhizobium sp.]RWF66831.1 MAG: glycoside hydrolase [Mesorhizobium sp.]